MAWAPAWEDSTETYKQHWFIYLFIFLISKQNNMKKIFAIK